jgi:choline monooxygenase
MSRTPDYLDEATYAPTRLPVNYASTLLPEAYRDPAFYALEQERLWATSWVCVGFTQQLQRVGDTFLATVGDQSLLVTRSDAQTLRAFYNTCRHRGAQLLSSCGNHKYFRCPYHAWGYDLDGKLKGTPYFEPEEVSAAERAIYDSSGMKAFDRADYGLLPVRVETWGCFVFVNLDDRAAPLAEQLGDVPERVACYPLTDLVLTRTVDYSIGANWKLVAENYMEYYHLPWVHPTLNRVSHLNNHYPFQGEGWYYGMTTAPLDEDPEVSLDKGLPPMPGLEAEEQESARWLWLFPNIAISLLPYHLATMLLVPDGPGRTQERFDFFFHPDALDLPQFACVAEQVYDLWDLTNREDIAIVEAVQQGLANRAYRGGRMCYRFEESIHRFQNHVIDKMVAKAGVVERDVAVTKVS